MPAGIWQIAIVGVGPQGEAVVNTFHYETSTETLSTAIADEFCIQVRDNLLQDMLPALTDDWTGFQISALCVSGLNALRTSSLGIPTEVGAMIGTSAPMQSTAIIKRQGAAVGRHGRGRVYISPTEVSQFDVDGRFTPSGAEFTNLAVAMLSPINVLGLAYRPVLWDKEGLLSNDVISTSVSQIAGVRRSRRLRFPN